MQKLMLLSLACALISCSDGKTSSTNKVDAGEENESDAGNDTTDDDAGETKTSSGLERAPGSLPRPPAKKLPDDLKPPGFGK